MISQVTDTGALTSTLNTKRVQRICQADKLLMKAEGVDSFGFRRTVEGGVKKAKKKPRPSQRRRRKLKERKMAEMLQPEVITLSDDEHKPMTVDLRVALKAKKQAQTGNVKKRGNIEATETGEPDDLRTVLRGKKPEPTTIIMGELAASLDELEPENLARRDSPEIFLVETDQAPRGHAVAAEANPELMDGLQASTSRQHVSRPITTSKVDQATSTADLMGPDVVDGVLWRRVIDKAKQALKEIRDDPDEVALNLWTGTNAEQRDLWSICWPKVDPETLDALIDETPRYSTYDTHIDMSLKLALAVKVIGYCTFEKATALMESSRWHMRIANYIEKCNFNNAKPADDHVCHYGDGMQEDELVIGISVEDEASLGLSPEGAAVPAPTKSWYNPLNDEENEGILWVSSESTRLGKWMAYVDTKYEIKSIKDAIENFAHPGDDLTDVNVHASTAIRLMKMREIVSGKEIKDLLFMAALSHLKVVSSFHPVREGRWRPAWPSSKFH